MRVLHVLSSLNIGSGIANCIMNYYRKIVACGIRFDFLVFEKMPEDYLEEVQALGGRVFYIKKPTLNFGVYNRQIKEFFTEHTDEWEIVHISEILVQKFIIKNAKKYGKVKKIIMHSHASKFVLPKAGVSAVRNAFGKIIKTVRNSILLKGFKKKTDYFLACSDEAGKALFGKKIVESGKNYSVLKNSIDAELYNFDENIRAEYRRQLNLENKKVIIQVGRLTEQKNPLFTLEIFKTLSEADSKFYMLFVGDGNLRKDCEERVEKLGIKDSVAFLGNRTDVPDLLLCADLFLLPSLTEGLGIVYIEAQAAGLPCIASTGVPREVEITPYIQFLNLNDGAKVWAKTISDTELNRYDTRKFVEDSGYDITHNAQELIEIYNGLLEN